MTRNLTSRSSLAGLKREAKRWLRTLRANDPDARARFVRAHPHAPAHPGLRHVQQAIAREYGFPGWAELTAELSRRHGDRPAAGQADVVPALLLAAGKGDVERVGQILDTHPHLVDERGALGQSGLRTALHFGVAHEPVVRLLLDHGADPDVRDEGDNATALHFAAERGDLDVVRLLVENGADPTGDGTFHELTALGWATCFDYAYHPDVAGYLLAHGARHTIHTAVAMGDTDAVRDLVARDPADLERPMDATNHHRRPLHLAVAKGQARALTTLLGLGADPEAQDAAGLTPLDQAALSGARDLADLLVARGAVVRLPAAVGLGRVTDVDRLLREDPGCLRPGGRWERLVLRASGRASGEVIDALIRRGASVDVRDSPQTAVDGTNGYTALHGAAFQGNLPAVRVLLRHGASRTVREEKYLATPVGWADYAGHTEIRDLILDGPVDIIDAIAFDRLDRVTEVLADDPPALDRALGEFIPGDGTPSFDLAWTPLAYAVAHGKVDAARLLVERGADRSVRDSEGRGLRDIALAHGHTAVMELLDQYDT
ncbi:ankyrin repeat domain-containing protein [Actinopolymorpha sp. B9G3]|uniref:ankyrin repeat domain-containing protein n=1 Tax=Actinopolymorpha sp. B9G3 TaxID=3158970 RepID=UPI0032D9645D